MKFLHCIGIMLVVCLLPLSLFAEEQPLPVDQNPADDEDRFMSAGFAYSSAYGYGLSLRWDPLEQWRLGLIGLYLAEDSGDNDTVEKSGSLGLEVQRNLFILQRPKWKSNHFRGFISAGASWSYRYSKTRYYAPDTVETKESQFLAGGVGLGLAFILHRRASFEISFLYQYKERTEGTYQYIGPGFGCAAHLIF